MLSGANPITTQNRRQFTNTQNYEKPNSCRQDPLCPAICDFRHQPLPYDGLLRRDADLLHTPGGYTIILTGLILIAVSISIITKKFVKLSTLILAGLLFIFIIAIHIPHLINGADRPIILIALLKDVSLMGGSLMIAGMYSDEEKQNTKK